MSTLAAQPHARRLTADFLTALAAGGYRLGVDDYQRVQELLLRLPADTDPATLGDSLVALFARSAAEQQRTRELFRQVLAQAAATAAPPPVTDDPELTDRVTRDRRRLIAAAALLAVPALVLLLFWWTRVETYRLPDQQRTVYYYPPPNDSLVPPDTLYALDSLPEIGRVTAYAWPPPAAPGAPRYGRLDSIGGRLTYEVLVRDTLRDTVRLTLTGTHRRRAELRYVFQLRPDSSVATTIPRVATVDTAGRATVTYLPIDPLPHPRGLADLAPATADGTALRAWLHRWWWLLVAAFFSIAAAGLFFLLRYLYRRRIQLVARRATATGAPHFWRIELPEQRAAIDWGERFGLLLRQLRRRQEDTHRELDIGRTVRATVDRGGLLDLRYRAATRPPEYLLLIDRGGADNHRARLFEALYQRLLAEEVLVVRYFYDGDPRSLYQDDRGNTTSLAELQRRLGNARLVLVGDGARLLNAATGRPAKWAAELLSPWAQRSLLSSVPTDAWGRTERQLAQLLPVLPASLEGLRLLVERQRTGTASSTTTDYRQLIADAAHEPVHLQGSLLGSLERAYSPPLLRWIAACALYPALHWDLTLYLGQEVAAYENKASATYSNNDTPNQADASETNTSANAVPPPSGEGVRGWDSPPPPAYVFSVAKGCVV